MLFRSYLCAKYSNVDDKEMVEKCELAINEIYQLLNSEDKEINIYSVGPSQINSFVSEFSNLSERGLKARGKKIKYFTA